MRVHQDFSGGSGAIYTIVFSAAGGYLGDRQDGKLLWYRHNDPGGGAQDLPTAG
jgi:hypothetical protein